MFKTELHCHSATVSACGRTEPERIVELYLAAGYTSLVLTEHINNATFTCEKYKGPDDWQSKIDHYMEGYHRLKQAAGKDLFVILGLECKLLCHSDTDLLVHGVTEEFLRATPDLVYTDFKTFSTRVREAGMLLFQAHPFRNNMLVLNPEYLDGYEIYNGHFKQNSRNDMAEIWAARMQKKVISGTDLHHEDCPIAGGILTEQPITSSADLLKTLREGNYTLIREGTPLFKPHS